jgi:hypothetical protein
MDASSTEPGCGDDAGVAGGGAAVDTGACGGATISNGAGISIKGAEASSPPQPVNNADGIVRLKARESVRALKQPRSQRKCTEFKSNISGSSGLILKSKRRRTLPLLKGV